MLKAVIALALVTGPYVVCGQTGKADQKIREIEGFRKFKIRKSDMSQPQGSDTSIRVLELAWWTTKKSGLEKVVQRSTYQGTRIKRTAYFDESAKLFAINDSIRYPDKSKRVFTYYFNQGKMRAFDESHNDATHMISADELLDWIRSVFDNAILN